MKERHAAQTFFQFTIFFIRSTQLDFLTYISYFIDYFTVIRFYILKWVHYCYFLLNTFFVNKKHFVHILTPQIYVANIRKIFNLAQK